MRLLYTSDLHGSDLCFRKLLDRIELEKPDVAVVGGDLTGKFLVPIVPLGGRLYRLGWQEPLQVVEAADAEALLQELADRGRYGVLMPPADWERLRDDWPARRERLAELCLERVCRWVEAAEERLGPDGPPLYLQPGNDDRPAVGELLTAHENASAGAARVRNPEERALDLPGGLAMVSLGWVNTTPFHSPRELDDQELGRRLDALMGRLPPHRWPDTVLNVHAPPHASGLDSAYVRGADFQPLLEDGRPLRAAAGSRAVRAALERYQPLLGLHGHIHESAGSAHIGRTLCVNLGTEYEKGALVYALFELERGRPPRRETFVV